MNSTFMKEKPVGPLLASMALPMVFSMLVNSLYNIVDSFFVAQISEQAMTALSLVYPVQNMINAVAIGFGIGINARVSYHLGAGDKKMADTAATHGFFLSVIHGILMTVISIAVMPVFLQMYTQDETVIRMGLEYSTIVFLFSTVIAISLFFEKLFQAVGRMKVSMLALLVGCISNIILDPFLIWGIGFFPKLGIRGAALATGIGQVLTIAVYMVFYILKPIPVRVTPKALKTSKETDLSLYAIGVPAILNLALPSFLISFLNSVLAAYSDSYVVILGIYYKLQTFLYLPANGIIQGMRPLIGYNFGAREMKRVKKIFRLTLESSCVIMLFGTVICLLASGQLMGLFTTTPETIVAGSRALKIISAGFLVSAVSVTTSGAMEGLGKGTQSLVISLFRYVVVIMPTAYLLSHFMGPDGVWNAFWITEVFTAIVSVMIYHKTLKKPENANVRPTGLFAATCRFTSRKHKKLRSTL